jgi:hypothetical protein
MNKYMKKAIEVLEKRRNYLIYFYKGEDVLVSPKEAAKIKYAIMNEIKCFTLKDSLYMTSNVASIVRRREQEYRMLDNVDLLGPPQEYEDAIRWLSRSSSMDAYLDDNGNLLENPIKQLKL